MTHWLTFCTAASLLVTGVALGVVVTLWLIEAPPFPALRLRLRRHRMRYLRWPLNWLRLLYARSKPATSKEPA